MQSQSSTMPVWARILTIIVAFSILAGIFQLIGSLFFGNGAIRFGVEKSPSVDEMVMIQFYSFLACIFVVSLFRKKVDRASLLSLGFSIRNRCIDFVAGFLVAFLIFGLGTMILILIDSIKLVDFHVDFPILLKSLFLFILVSFTEEILVRGYILNNLLTSMNKYFALLISSAIFASLHLFNPHISTLSLLNLFLAGVLLGASYIFTKNLWFPISLHLFWNFIQGPIWGFPVSGEYSDSLFCMYLVQKDSINGGDFGFEGSMICTILSIIFIVVIISYYERGMLRRFKHQRDG